MDKLIKGRPIEDLTGRPLRITTDIRLKCSLTPARIAQFEHFKADASHVGKNCVCCLDDFEVGRELVKFDCQHLLCKMCTDTWFSNHNTCFTCGKNF